VIGGSRVKSPYLRGVTLDITGELMQIVLARVEEEQVIIRHGRRDLGESHRFKTVPKPVSLMWLNEGTKRDVLKAKEYAKDGGYTVLCYEGEDDPLGRARREILTH
jgi:hypothetical protein